MAPLVSIIVISKDDPRGLRLTLDSIASQAFEDAEVVLVVKGGSEQVDPAEFGLGRVQRLVQQGSGISNAFNEGLACARGRWINFLNGGDAYRGPAVLHGLQPLLTTEGHDLVAGRAQDLHTGVMIPRDHSFRARDLELVSHQATFFERRLFEAHGTYSPAFRIRMDFEWMLRLRADATSVAWVDDVLVAFEGQGISSTQPWRSCQEELRALRLHGRGALRMARLLLLMLPFRVVRAQARRMLA